MEVFVSKILVVSLIVVSMLSVSCEDNEFTNTESVSSKLAAAEVSGTNLLEENEEAIADEVATDEEVEVVIEQMEVDLVVDFEPIEEVIKDSEMLSTYTCKKRVVKPYKLKKRKKCKKKKKHGAIEESVAEVGLDGAITEANFELAEVPVDNESDQAMTKANNKRQHYNRRGLASGKKPMAKRVMLCMVSKNNPDKARTKCVAKGVVEAMTQKGSDSLSYLGPCIKDM